MFDFIGNQLSRTLGKQVAEAADEKPLNPFHNGPIQFRSGGQSPERRWRRMQVRRAASQKRKTNKRFRREWMKNERAYVTLRQQLVVVGAIPSQHYPEPALADNVERHLETAYGSVDKALEYFAALEAERAA